MLYHLYLILRISVFGFLTILGSGCSQQSGSSTQKVDLKFTWIEPSTMQERKITQLEKCVKDECSPLRTEDYVITSGPSTDNAAEVEVCQNGPNPFIQTCDVYDCYETDVQSVCEFQYTYNRNCMSDSCPAVND